MTSDTELVLAAQAGDARAGNEVVERFAGLAYSLAAHLYIDGADRDDVRQEALVGLWGAVRSFRPDRGAPFPTFAWNCIHRHLASRMIAARRVKHRLLSQAARAGTGEEGETIALVERLPDPRDPVAARAELREIVARLPRLSPLERRALAGVVSGFSYAELAGTGSTKSVDNALWKARRKLAA